MDTYFNDTNFFTNMDDDPRDPEIFTSMKAFDDRYFGGENDDLWSPQCLEDVRQKKIRTKARFTPDDRKQSMFYLKYVKPHSDNSIAFADKISNDDSLAGKNFRRLFRVPYALFIEICEDMIEKGYYIGGTCRNGWPMIELDILVLGGLRYIGSGCSYDLIEKATNVSAVTHRNFMKHKFAVWGQQLCNEVASLPESNDALRRIVGLYEQLGVPGCMGSVDCVHLVWDKCPAGLLAQCRGKEKFPTLVFEVVSTHSKKIIHVSNFYYGATNDKTISRYDRCMIDIHGPKAKPLFKNYEWTSIDSNDKKSKRSGAYFICDGGYHPWSELMPPYKNQLDGSDACDWSKHIASIRKDVECTFGILKKRWLILKNPIELHSPEDIENVFSLCCGLHNLLLDYDGFDDWEANGLLDNEDISIEYNSLDQSDVYYDRTSIYHNFLGNYTSGEMRRLNPRVYSDNIEEDNLNIPQSELDSFEKRRNILIEHYITMVDKHTLRLDLK